MRQVIPYIGNYTIISSIIIGMILVFSSFGYYFSGTIRANNGSIRKKILNNFIISLIFIFFGTTYIFVEYFFEIFGYFGISNPIIQAFLFSLIFLSVPSYLLSQTTPLVSNFFSKKLSGEMTGKMLMFGTFGSFAGSIFTTLFIMPLFGVSTAVFFNMFLMAVAIILISKKKKLDIVIVSLVFIVISFVFNNKSLEKELNILSNNGYSTIKVIETDDDKSKIMMINNSFSSKISEDDKLMFEYIKYINSNFIATMPKDKKFDILVLAAGGFTVGYFDNRNNYTFVDIDGSLLDVSEKYFLNKKLGKNKKFVVADARAFLRQNNKKYDLIILDTYGNYMDIPSQLITENYFIDVKNALKDNGVLVANIIASVNFGNKFSTKFNNTFSKVFENFSRYPISEINPWDDDSIKYRNIMYVYFNDFIKTEDFYTDDNSSSKIFDKGN